MFPVEVFSILAVILNSSANVECCCHRMVVGREMLGAASCYSLCTQGRASLQDGKMHMSMKKSSPESRAFKSITYLCILASFLLLAINTKASGSNGREVVAGFQRMLELYQLFLLLFPADDFPPLEKQKVETQHNRLCHLQSPERWPGRFADCFWGTLVFTNVIPK